MDQTQKKNYVSTGGNIAILIIIIAGVMASEAVILPILLALFLSIVLTKPILWLRKKKIPNTLAIVIVFVGIILIFMGIGALLGSSITSLSENIPEYEDQFSNIVTSFFGWMDHLGYNLTSRDITSKIDAGKVLKLLTSSLSELGGVMQNSILIMFIAVLMLLELDGFYYKSEVVKEKYGNKSLASLDRIAKSVRQYLWIQTLLSLLTGVLISISLVVIGVDYPILWGIVAFLLNYIPNIGSIIAAIPTILFALIVSGPGAALWTALIYLVINMIIGNMLQPKVMGKGLGLSTLIVFLSLLVWGFIFGTIGMFLSVPLTMTIKIILESNPNTKWMAIIMGSDVEAKEALHSHKNI
jgi:predicted PurR-regulated permease PerM